MNRVLRAAAGSVTTVRRIAAFATGFIPQSKWRLADDAEKFWSESDNRSQVRDLSHWLGEGRWSDEQAWLQVGEKHFNMFEMLCRLVGQEAQVSSIVEWGPGGGANAVRFCTSLGISRFYGVDISPANLAECQRQLQARDVACLHPILIDASHPERVLAQVREPVDLFLSTAVYQHFPSQEYGVQVTRLAGGLLKDFGLAIIQVRYDDGSEAYRSKERDYENNVITFTSYPVDVYWQILVDAGLEPLAVILEPNVRYGYYLSRKGSSYG